MYWSELQTQIKGGLLKGSQTQAMAEGTKKTAHRKKAEMDKIQEDIKAEKWRMIGRLISFPCPVSRP